MKFKSNIEIQAGLEDASGSPGTVNQLLSSTATGTAWIDPSTIVAEAATLVVIACKNTSGAAIAQGTPVYQTGTVGATATIEIAPADALISANKLPAIGLLQTALNNNGFGFVVITGELTNFTTSPIDGVVPTTGDKVFVKSGGGLTLTKPTGEGNGIQNMGLVGKVSSGNAGSITVSSIMRTNDVPNLPEGRIWVGDGNTIVSDTVYVDEPNNRVGIGTTNPGTSLEVQSSGANTLPATTGTTLSTGTRFRLASTGSASAVLDFGISTGGKSWLQSTDKTDLSVEYPFLINPNGGDVGIGTSSPGDALVVKGGSPGNIDLVSFQNNAGNETHRFYTDSANDGVIETVTNAGVTANLIQSSGDSYFNGGKVGIGTTSPSNILHTYVNNTDTSIPGILVEQAGTGDSSIGFLLSGVRTWSVGVDNSDSDKFVIGSGEDLGTSSKMVIDTSGNVGIGTTSPQASLQIGNAVGTSSEKLDVRGNSSGNYVASFEQDNATGYGLLIDTDGTLVSEPVLKIKNSSSELFYVGSNGNVGIGTINPDTTLHVDGGNVNSVATFESTDDTARIILKDNDTSGYFIAKDNVISIGGSTTIANNLNVDVTSGNVGIGTDSPSRALEVVKTDSSNILGVFDSNSSNTQIAFSDANSTAGQYSTRIGSIGDSLGFWTNGSNERMRITSGGNVGIGTETNSAVDTNNGVPRLQVNTETAVLGEFPLAARFTTDVDAGDNSGVSVLINSGNDRGLMISAGRAVSNRARATLNLVQYDGNELVDGITLYQPNTASGGATTGTNVGIGTTSPSEKLDVVGNIELNGALYIGSRGIYQQENTDVDTGTETVANVAIATYTAAFFDFVIKKTTNVRSGTVYACHDGTNVEFTETSTNDLGDTSDVTLSVDISGTNMRLLATVTSDDWSVKSLIRAI
ncbi:hypothetical protein N9Q05_01955 [bacterium]|nr:hypothetical protein [bacterium]